MEISSTHLRYLVAIYEISQKTPDVCSASVANRMQVSKPSVARMLVTPMKKQLIVKELYGKIYLTDKGFLLACEFDQKVRLLTERIPRMGLRLTEEEIDTAACAMAAAFINANPDAERKNE